MGKDRASSDQSELGGALAKLAAAPVDLSADLPVESWTPPFGGDIPMRIARDGRWFYEGSEISRPAMVQLFARLLRKDADRYVLVTPAECLGIEVEDVPFIAVEMEAGNSIRFRINLGDDVTVDAAHPLHFDKGEADGIVPYVLVRGGLWARLTRALTLDLIAFGEEREIAGIAMFGVKSGDCFFPIAPWKNAGDAHQHEGVVLTPSP